MKVIKIGRGPRNDFVVSDEYVSRNHCQITELPSENKYLLEDLSSTWGTFVDGKSVIEKKINLNDYLILGKNKTITYSVKQILDSCKKNDPNDFSSEFNIIKNMYLEKEKITKQIKDNLTFFNKMVYFVIVALLVPLLKSFEDLNNMIYQLVYIIFYAFLTILSIKKLPKVREFYLKKIENKYENKFNCPRCNHSLEKARKDIPNLKYCPNGCGASFIKK